MQTSCHIRIATRVEMSSQVSDQIRPKIDKSSITNCLIDNSRQEVIHDFRRPESSPEN